MFSEQRSLGSLAEAAGILKTKGSSSPDELFDQQPGRTHHDLLPLKDMLERLNNP